MRRATPRRDILIILSTVLVVALPAFLTLATVRSAPGVQPPDTPLGYTVSLLLFLVPVLAVGVWHLWHPKHPIHRRALLTAVLAITLIGVVLDFIFGYAFFTFPNPDATLGIRLPAWSFGEGRWIPDYLPLEEFGFYLFGALFVVAIYIWADLNWLPDYDFEDFETGARRVPRLVHFSPRALAFWIALLAAGLLYKKLGPHDAREGMPGYFIFQMVLGLLPNMLFVRSVWTFINWRAFGFAYGILLLVSLVWEATLGVPFGWWNYKGEQMLGIRITAWSDLPIEAVLLWLIVAWNCVIAYEIFRIYYHMGRRGREALFGVRAGGGA